MACASCEPSYMEYSVYPGENIEMHTIKWTFNGVYFLKHRKKMCTEESIIVTSPANPVDKVFRLEIEKLNTDINLSFLVVKPVTVLKVRWKCFDTRLCGPSTTAFYISPDAPRTWTVKEIDVTQYLKDGDLVFNVSFKIKKTQCHLIINNENKILSGSSLITDFEKLLSNELFSDVTVKSSEDKEYKVHKAILASRSAVLKAHFDHNTTECHTNVLESSLESEVLTEVLTFIYSDKAPRIHEIPDKLLAAADYYQLIRLKCMSENVLIKKLTVENAIDTLQAADLYSAESLKSKTLEFIKNNFQAVCKSDGFEKLQSPELMKEIFRCMATHSG